MKAPVVLMALVLVGCATASEPPSSQPADFYGDLSGGERAAASAAVQNALERFPSGQSHFWSVPDGTGGSITPTRTTQNANGVYCRNFEEIVVRPESGTKKRKARACRNKRTKTWQPA